MFKIRVIYNASRVRGTPAVGGVKIKTMRIYFCMTAQVIPRRLEGCHPTEAISSR